MTTGMDESWTPGIGQDIHDAGVQGVVIPVRTEGPNGPIFWFQKVGVANKTKLNWSMVKELNSIGQVYLVRYMTDYRPYQLVDMKHNRSLTIDRASLQAFIQRPVWP
jgi:hypothetical protein